ncbi:MAG: hypothetical protein LLG04_16395 [Parachlamydia sp.]|nr:hypothetical protein [Parachlamydia sp.]
MEATSAIAFAGPATPQIAPPPTGAFSLAERIERIREGSALNEEPVSNSSNHKRSYPAGVSPSKRPRAPKEGLTSEEAELLLVQMVQENLSQSALIQALDQLGTLWKEKKMPLISEKAHNALLQLSKRLYTLLYPCEGGAVGLTVDDRALAYVRTLLAGACKGSFSAQAAFQNRDLPVLVRGFMIHAALRAPNLHPYERLRLCADFSCPGLLLLPPAREALLGPCRDLRDVHRGRLIDLMPRLQKRKETFEKNFAQLNESTGDQTERLENKLLTAKQAYVEQLDKTLKFEELIKALETFAKIGSDAEFENLSPAELEVLAELVKVLCDHLEIYLLFQIYVPDFTDFVMPQEYDIPCVLFIQRAMTALVKLQNHCAHPQINASLLPCMQVLSHPGISDTLSFKKLPTPMMKLMQERLWSSLYQIVEKTVVWELAHHPRGERYSHKTAQRVAKILHLLGMLAEPTPEFAERLRGLLTPLIPLGRKSKTIDPSDRNALYSALVSDCAEWLPLHDHFNVLTLFAALGMFAEIQLIPVDAHEHLMNCVAQEGFEISDEAAADRGVIYMSGMLDAYAKLIHHPALFDEEEAPKDIHLRYLCRLVNNNLTAACPAPHIVRKTLVALAKLISATKEHTTETDNLELWPETRTSLYRWWQALDLHLLESQDILNLLSAMCVLVEAYPPRTDMEHMAIIGLLTQASNQNLLDPAGLQQSGTILMDLQQLLKTMTAARLSRPVASALESLQTRMATLLHKREQGGRR